MEPLPFIQLVVTRTWQHRDSNPGPLAWDASALPTELAILPVDVRSSVYVLKDKFHACKGVGNGEYMYNTPLWSLIILLISPACQILEMAILSW